MRQIREVLRLCWESRLPQRAVARSLGLGQGTVSSYLSRARAAGLAWPLPEDLDDGAARSAAVPAALRDPGRSAPDARLGLGASRAAPSRRDAGAAVGGVPRRRARRVRLFLVLRSLPGLGRAAEADDAPGPCRRREAVRRFRRPHRRGDRRPHRRDHAGADLRRRARAPRASPTPRRCGARSCRTGSPRMSAPSPISAAPRGRRSATI